MLKNRYVTVGKVRDAHGLKGEVFCVLFGEESPWLEKTKTVTLERREPSPESKELKPVQYRYEIARSKAHKAGLILRLQGLDDRTQAEGFRGAMLLVPEEAMESQPGERIFLRELKGFEVLKLGEPIGRLVDFSSNNAQDLIVVETPKGRFEIPLVEEFLIAVDFKKKTLNMDIPEGLLGETIEDAAH